MNNHNEFHHCDKVGFNRQSLYISPKTTSYQVSQVITWFISPFGPIINLCIRPTKKNLTFNLEIGLCVTDFKDEIVAYFSTKQNVQAMHVNVHPS